MFKDDLIESVILYIEVPKVHDEIENIDDLINTMNSHKKIEVYFNVIIHNENRILFTLDHIQYKDRSSKVFKLHLISNHEYKVSGSLKRDLIKLFKSRDLLILTLWDDTYQVNAFETYRKIHNLENRFRSKLNEDMLNNYGENWHKKYFPPKLKNSISRNLKKETTSSSQDLFMSMDFIDISNFLFEKFNTENIDEIILSSEEVDSKLLLDLKENALQDNWRRVFKNVFTCEATKFQNNWEKLYGFRNLIAHNRPFNQQDFDDTNELVDYFNKLLLKSKRYFRPDVKIESTTRTGTEFERCPKCGEIHAFMCTISISYNSIVNVQKALTEKGYSNSSNGIMDIETKRALASFQKENNLQIGALDFDTLMALGLK
jgi:hypothetical protein